MESNGIIQMATIKQMIRSVETQLEIEVHEVDVLIASYMCNGMSLLEVSETMGIADDELSALVNTNEFQQIRQIIQLDLAKSKQDIDGGWDSIEQRALQALNEHVDLGITSPEEALKLASVANKAERRGTKKSEAIGGQQGGVLTLSLTQNFINKIQNGGSTKELPEQVNQVIDGEVVEMKESVHVDQGSGKVNGNGKGTEGSLGSATDRNLTGLGCTIQPNPEELDSVLNLSEAIKNQGSKTQEGKLLDSVFADTDVIHAVEEVEDALGS